MKRKIIISESTFKRLIEGKLLLAENLGRQMQKARKVLRSYGYSDDDSRKKVEAWETVSYFQRIDGFGLPGFARLYADGQIKDAKTLNFVYQIIEFIAKHHADKVTTDLTLLPRNRKLSVDDLISYFGEETKNEINKPSEKKERVRNKRYKFYRIPNFKDAKPWRNIANWCICENPFYYNHETNNGSGIFVFCIRDDVRDRYLDNTNDNRPPYDDYGLSAIAVCVEEDGSVYSCTSRWNHSQGNKDGSLFNKEELEDLFGVNFEEIFYPRTEEEQFVNEHTERTKEDFVQELLEQAVPITTELYLFPEHDIEAMTIENNGRYAITVYNGNNFFSITDYEFESDAKCQIINNILIIESIDETYYACNIADVNQIDYNEFMSFEGYNEESNTITMLTFGEDYVEIDTVSGDGIHG